VAKFDISNNLLNAVVNSTDSSDMSLPCSTLKMEHSRAAEVLLFKSQDFSLKNLLSPSVRSKEQYYDRPKICPNIHPSDYVLCSDEDCSASILVSHWESLSLDTNKKMELLCSKYHSPGRIHRRNADILCLISTF
jgi:hypothetical protein